MYQHLLVPTDGSNLAMETIVKAVAFARSLGARITFLHAMPGRVEGPAGPTEGIAADAVAAEGRQTAVGNAMAALGKAEAEARAFRVPFASTLRFCDQPYDAIADAADEFHCDLIFMSSHGLRGVPGADARSQTQQVLARSRVPVLVCTVEDNQVLPDAEAAIATIRQEHRSLAAVMHGLLHQIREARAGRAELNVALMRMMMRYIRDFPQKLHHPKEEQFLFARLRARTSDPCGTIADLCEQHAAEFRLVDAVSVALDACERRTPFALDDLAEAADAYADALWTHMSIEEKVILPSARAHLTAEDWREVAAAFAANRDPDFSAHGEGDYSVLFTRIMNLVTHEPPAAARSESFSLERERALDATIGLPPLR